MEVKLTAIGEEYYREMVQFLDPTESQDVHSLVKAYDSYVYKDSSRIKRLGLVPIQIDTAVAALRIPEFILTVVQRVRLYTIF